MATVGVKGLKCHRRMMCHIAIQLCAIKLTNNRIAAFDWGVIYDYKLVQISSVTTTVFVNFRHSVCTLGRRLSTILCTYRPTV